MLSKSAVFTIASWFASATLPLLAQDSRTDSVGSDERRLLRLRADAIVPSRAFPTIQSAIDAVEDGGSIFVNPGTFREQLNIGRKRVRLTGSGPRGPGRTEIVGPSSNTVDEHTRAVGLVTYAEGGGGVIEGLALRGGLNGIVGHAPSARPGVPVPDPSSNALTVRDVFIRNTGRAVLWHAPADLTLREVSASNLRHNGIVFAPLAAGGLQPGPGALHVSNVNVVNLLGFGVLVLDTPSIGCQNQLSDVDVTFAESGGIGVIRSGVCIFGGTLTFNRFAGIYFRNSAAIVDGSRTQSSLPLPDGRFGDGIASILSEITTTNLFVNLNARAGMSVFGGSASMAWNTFNCNSFDLELEDLPAGFFGPSDPPADSPGELTNPVSGSNVCGCGDAEGDCAALSGQVSAPDPINP